MEAKRKSFLPVEASSVPDAKPGYNRLLSDISGLLEQARRTSARAVNSVLTVTYWEIGRRIVEFEQSGRARAGYGERLLDRLSTDLAREFGRGYSRRNIEQMRAFYLGWKIPQTVSAKLKENMTLPGESDLIGIILCGGKDEALVRYATGGIKAKVFASRYLTVLPNEETLKREILKARRLLEGRWKKSP